MSNQAFQQNLNDKKGPQPGGPYLIQMLFKEPAEMPDKEKMTAVMEKHIGSAECFCYDQKMAGFAAQDHIAEFKDGKCPVQPWLHIGIRMILSRLLQLTVGQVGADGP